MQDVVIVAATRTAIGAFQGALANISAPALGAAVIRRLLEQTGLNPAEVDEVILGQVLTAGAGQNPARQASVKAGLPHAVPSFTLNKVCGSGLKALHLATQAIRCGDAEVIIAGGQENMSLAPYVLPKARTGLRMGHAELVDSMISDGLWDAFNDFHMGITAENLVDKYGISREAQDAFAAVSQQKAVAAIDLSKPSVGALEFAASVSFFGCSSLMLLHAYMPLASGFMRYASVEEHRIEDYARALADEARSALENLAKTMPLAGLKPELLIEEGATAEVIADVIARKSPQLVVLGTTGNSILKNLVIGSVANAVLRDAECDVLAYAGRRETA